MGYEISWYEPQRVILLRIQGDLTPEVIQNAGDDLRRYIDEGTMPIHLLADFTHLGNVPPTIAESRKHLGRLDRLSTSVIIGLKNPVIKFMANVFAKLGGYEVRTVSSLDEAAEVITRLDPSLQHLSKAKSN